MNQIRLLEKTWKAGLAILAIGALVLGTLVFRVVNTSAHGAPVMTTILRVNDVNDFPDQGWSESLNSQTGHRLQFDIEIHNTVVGTSAHDVTAQIQFPSGESTNLTIPLTVTATNANTASDSVTVNLPLPAGRLVYVGGSTRLWWDQNGDGILDFDNAQLVDGIVGGGIRIGNQSGCNEFIIKIDFLADLVGVTPSPSPSPTPTPGASPSPTPASTPTQTQTVDVTGQPVVTTAVVPLKQPETGLSVLGMASMFSAAPIGLALARYGRGRSNLSKREEELITTANSIFSTRLRQKSN